MFNNEFALGVNYWASNAGTKMWENFDEIEIEKDFKVFSEFGINTIRIFPLWHVFQPINMFYSYVNTPYEIRYADETPFPDTPAGKAGIDEKMIGKMEKVLDLAKKYDISIIFALLTGWMSGKMFVPPLLEGKSLITNMQCVKWETKYIKYLVNRFKYHSSIVAWDLGNECDCLEKIEDRDVVYSWISHHTNTIKANDQSRLVVSGLGCNAPGAGAWEMEDFGEILDILVTHPYNFFQQKCLLDKSISLRAIMHSSMETSMNRDLSGKPTFVEEIGTLGTMYTNDENTANFIRANLYETLSQGFGGFLWWCGFDQNEFKHIPYDWVSSERQLGMFRADRSPKPIAYELLKFSKLMKEWDISDYKGEDYDAVCILSKETDTWAIAFASFMLSRQADFKIKFITHNMPIPDAKLYLLPSIAGFKSISLCKYEELLHRVKKGAVLYTSFGNRAFLSPFDNVFGVNVDYIQEKNSVINLNLNGNEISIPSDYYVKINVDTAKVICFDQFNNPALFMNNYGEGKVIALNAPLEKWLGDTSDVLSSLDAQMYYEIYNFLKNEANIKKHSKNNNRYIVKTEWGKNESLYIILICCSEMQLDDTVILEDGYKISKVYCESFEKISDREMKITLHSGGVCIIKAEK